MYKLSEAAAKDIEDILDRSIVEFGPLQTETYYGSLSHCVVRILHKRMDANRHIHDRQ